MKKVVFLFLISSVLIFCQKDDKQNQNVELPDFVITGTEKVTVDKAKKVDPDLIPVTSEEFIKPVYSPEDLELKKFSNPLKKDINFYDSVHYQKGYIDGAVGFNNIPTGRIFYSTPFSGGLFNGEISGLNRRAYVPNADKIVLDGSAQLDFFSNDNSAFLPGSQYKIKAGYGINSYKVYGFDLPNNPTFTGYPYIKRTVNNFNGSVGFRNFESDHFQASVDAGADITGIDQENFTDNLFFVSGYANLQTENFLLSVESKFKTISIANKTFSATGSSFFSILPKMGLRISDIFKTDIGLYFSRGVGVVFMRPYFSVTLKVAQKASLFAEFNPHSEYINAAEYLKENPYLDLKNFYNQYVDYNGFLKLGVKYENEKYFQINAGINYKSSGVFRYYTPSDTKGFFNVAFTDAKMFDGYMDLLYHLGPLGYFYGRLDLKAATDSADMRIPYIPLFSTKAAYGFSFKKNLDVEIGINYFSSVYTDRKNTTTIPSFTDLGVKFSYLYTPGLIFTLEFSNLFNRENYIWDGYKEMPLNVSAGIRFLL